MFSNNILISPYIRAHENYLLARDSKESSAKERIVRLVLAILELIPFVNMLVHHLDLKFSCKKIEMVKTFPPQKKETPSIDNKKLSLLSSIHQKIRPRSNAIFKTILSLGLGVATIPLNVIIHEWGHKIAGLALVNDCYPKIHYEGFGLMGSYVSFSDCNINSKNINSIIAAGGPVFEITAALTLLTTVKSKYRPIFLAPHLLHIALHFLLPIFPGTEESDYGQLFRNSKTHYALAAAFAITPIALSIKSIYSSCFKPTEQANKTKSS